ncbi:MAG TPA: acyl--CoA ligase family protein, partial [Burkholderiales bacterium]|nr:acyl--CoA ligase family protein [Burkholderiales bacterium]
MQQALPQLSMSFEPLTPTAFLKRSATVFADRVAVIDSELSYTYAEFYRRALQLAGALHAMGATAGARVAVLAPNTHVLLEAHYGVPLAGAVLVALNQRLTANDLAYALRHCDAKVLIYDHELESVAREISQNIGAGLKLVRAGGSDEYEAWIAAATPHAEPVADERSLLSINYTSGTTGMPKGVMYHHRGAYLQALAMAAHMRLDCASHYLWTLPMFHCNGWCFSWGVTAAGATHLCLRKLDPELIWRHLRDSNVTHFCAAPTVLIMIAWAEGAKHGRLQRVVHAATGGAPPTPAILTRMAELGIEVTHLYGLTETFGPAVVCEWRPEWNKLPVDEQGQLKARQGVGNTIAQELRVIDIEGRDVPADAKTIGEIALRGNNVMLGYYRDEEATRRAAPDGWFRTGDLGVMHADRYVEIKDRSKDIILSGGENIASVEVERALAAHAAVMEAAVVAGPDPKWGEVPIAYVTLKPGAAVTEAELIAHARSLLAHFKAPKKIVFGELPKNATGKIQKFVLRERAK